MAAPGVLLALGGVLAAAGGGAETPMDFEVEAAVLQAEEAADPKCFSRRLHDLLCFWDSDGPPDPQLFQMHFRLDSDPWQRCPLSAARRSALRSRFWCSVPPSAAVAFVPLELRVVRAHSGAAVHRRTVFVERVVLLAAPHNVSAHAGGAPGALCVRWQPPPNPYLESSLTYELLLRAPGTAPRTVGVPVGRLEQRVGALRGRTPYTVRVRVRPDGLSYGGYWSPWSEPITAVTAPDVDPVTVGLSSLLALLLLGLAMLALLGQRRKLQEKLWPPVPGPEREFEGLFSAYGGNFQLWLYQGVVEPWSPPGGTPEAEEQPSAVEEVGPPPGKEPPPGTPPSAPPSAPPSGPSPASSFEYTLFDPGSALLCPRGHPQIAPPHDPPGGPYANLAPPHKGSPPPEEGTPKETPHDRRPPRELPCNGNPPGTLLALGPPPMPPPYVLCS